MSRASLARWWVALASGVAGGLLYLILASDLPLATKVVITITTFVAWAGGIATAYLFNP